MSYRRNSAFHRILLVVHASIMMLFTILSVGMRVCYGVFDEIKLFDANA